MVNKYLYSLSKDSTFRFAVIASIIGAVICVIFLRLALGQGLENAEIQRKRVLVAQIPALKARIQELGSVNGLVLNGIISDKKQPMAVINNVLIKVGGEIEGRKVTAITDHGVTVCETASDEKCVQLLVIQ
jgi:uncharacterized membrane protein YeaQ/YmgE (transglycosylase-associated protein family)